MTKQEYLSALTEALRKRGVADREDIIAEYSQHFSFKLSDGYSEEEIAARLGDPTALAAQFDAAPADPASGRRALTVTGLCFADLFAGMFFVLMYAWAVVVGAFTVCCAALTFCLITGTNIYSLIPPMPYWCGAVFAVSTAALTVLSAVGSLYFFSFDRQLLRSFARFHKNALAAASGRAVLPSLPISPRFTPETRRRMRYAALISLSVFASCALLGIIVSMLSAGAPGFWHVWGWFGYKG